VPAPTLVLTAPIPGVPAPTLVLTAPIPGVPAPTLVLTAPIPGVPAPIPAAPAPTQATPAPSSPLLSTLRSATPSIPLPASLLKLLTGSAGAAPWAAPRPLATPSRGAQPRPSQPASSPAPTLAAPAGPPGAVGAVSVPLLFGFAALALGLLAVGPPRLSTRLRIPTPLGPMVVFPSPLERPG
jgi:hypothetical protein